MDKKIDANAFEAFATKAFNLSSEEVASLYNDAGELTDFTLLHNKATEKVSKLTGDSKNQYSRGLKEAAQKIEKELKDKYEVESDLIGVELIDHIIESKLGETRQDDKDIMKHPEVIKLINKHGKELKSRDKEWEQKLLDKETEIMSASLFNKVKAQAMAEFQNMNPILPGDAKKAQALSEILVNDLAKLKYKEDKDGFIPLNPDGTNYVNEFSHQVSFTDLVKSTAEKYFDFKKAEERSSAGNNNSDSEPTGRIRKPKDKEDFIKIMKDTTLTPQERVQINNLYKLTK